MFGASNGSMRTEALKCFVQAVKSKSADAKAPVFLPSFLTPGTLRPCFSPSWRSRECKRPSLRGLASVNDAHLSQSDAAKDLTGRPEVRCDGLHKTVKGRRKRDTEAWTALLDQCLPQSLRVSVRDPTSGSESEEPLPIEYVPSILANARKVAKLDLLSYIGVYQERWEAVFWLVKAMLAKCPPYSHLKRFSERLPTILWHVEGRDLDEITNGHIEVMTPKSSSEGLDQFLGNDFLGSGRTGVSEPRQILGEVWQGLGCMILQIEDRSTSNTSRAVIMAHVLQILAYMHHTSALPDSFYNYDIARDTSVLQRPPTLYLLSTRIMTVLSDVSWKSYWAGEMEKAESYGYELPPPVVQPQLPRVGAEIWLDLVLWACVEGGWISEAAWLVSEIERRQSNPELRWSVISWDEICSTKMRKLDWKTVLKSQIDRSRLNQATGIGIANLTTSNAEFEMGTRTISREVVLAIADGLVSTATVDNDLYGNSIEQVQTHLSSCQSLLQRGQADMDSGYVNALILRTLESSMIDIRREPGYLQRLLALILRQAQTRTSPLSLSSLTSNNMLDFSAAVLGLLHKMLDSFARQSSLVASLQAFRSIQDVIDSNRDTYIQDFADELRDRLFRGSESLEKVETHQGRSTPILYPEVPPFVMEAFLDLIVESKTFDLGMWLLFNDDVDSGSFSPSLFSETSLQPALLRFATATANDHLLMKVLENLEAPLPQQTLHALLRCQVAVNRWDAVEGILKHFRDTQGMAWTAVDAMSIASAIPALECKKDKAHMAQLLQAKSILQDLVQGEFNSPQNQANLPDLQEIRTANQLGRIFQSVTGTLNTINLGPEGYLGRAHYSVLIPSDAFNILLGSIVENYGPLAGIRLWERWCKDPTPSGHLEQSEFCSTPGDGSERVVQPTPTMVSLIMRPATEDLNKAIHSMEPTLVAGKTSQQESLKCGNSAAHGGPQVRLTESLTVSRHSLSVYNWCMDMYRRFGFSDEEIDDQNPVSMRHVAKRSQNILQ